MIGLSQSTGAFSGSFLGCYMRFDRSLEPFGPSLIFIKGVCRALRDLIRCLGFCNEFAKVLGALQDLEGFVGLGFEGGVGCTLGLAFRV